MDRKQIDLFDIVEGLSPVEPEALEDFRRAMTEEVIPETLRAIEERCELAVECREWQLKCPIT